MPRAGERPALVRPTPAGHAHLYTALTGKAATRGRDVGLLAAALDRLTQ